MYKGVHSTWGGGQVRGNCTRKETSDFPGFLPSLHIPGSKEPVVGLEKSWESTISGHSQFQLVPPTSTLTPTPPHLPDKKCPASPITLDPGVAIFLTIRKKIKKKQGHLTFFDHHKTTRPQDHSLETLVAFCQKKNLLHYDREELPQFSRKMPTFCSHNSHDPKSQKFPINVSAGKIPP